MVWVGQGVSVARKKNTTAIQYYYSCVEYSGTDVDYDDYI